MRIPEQDTEPQSELHAPHIPTPKIAYPEDAQPTVDLGHSLHPQLPASWEESRDLFVGVPKRSENEASPKLERRFYWVTLALVASIAAQVGGLAADLVVPAIAERIHHEEVTYHRVWKSSRSIRTAEQLGHPVPPELERLQREAERAAFSGDAARAAETIDEIDLRWPRKHE